MQCTTTTYSLTYLLFHFLVCASLCFCSRPCAQSARSQHHLGAPTAGGALQVSCIPPSSSELDPINSSCLPVRIVICTPSPRVSIVDEPLRRQAGIRPAKILVSGWLWRDCVSVFFLFFYFCSSFNLSNPPPQLSPRPPHLPSPLSEWSHSTTSLGWLAMKAEEASSQCWGRSEFHCLCACMCVSVFSPDLRALQNPIKRSSICWVCAGPFSGRQRAPECRSPILNMCFFFFLFPFFPSHSTLVIHAFLSLDDVAAREHFKPLVTKWESEPPK